MKIQDIQIRHIAAERIHKTFKIDLVMAEKITIIAQGAIAAIAAYFIFPQPLGFILSTASFISSLILIQDKESVIENSITETLTETQSPSDNFTTKAKRNYGYTFVSSPKISSIDWRNRTAFNTSSRYNSNDSDYHQGGFPPSESIQYSERSVVSNPSTRRDFKEHVETRTHRTNFPQDPEREIVGLRVYATS